MRFLLFLIPFTLQASDIYRLSDFNWRHSPGEVSYKFDTASSFGGTTMSASGINVDVEIFEVGSTSTLEFGLNDRLEMGIVASYTFIEESKTENTNEKISGIHTPTFTFGYQLVEEYPASHGFGLVLSLTPKMGEAVDEYNASDDKVGGNKISPATSIGTVLAYTKTLSDFWQIYFDLGWRHAFEGEKVKRKSGSEGIARIDPVNSISFTFISKYEFFSRRFLYLSLVSFYTFEINSTSPLGAKSKVEPNFSIGLGAGYGIEVNNSLHVTLNTSLIKQTDHKMVTPLFTLELSDVMVLGASVDFTILM